MNKLNSIRTASESEKGYMLLEVIVFWSLVTLVVAGLAVAGFFLFLR